MARGAARVDRVRPRPCGIGEVTPPGTAGAACMADSRPDREHVKVTRGAHWVASVPGSFALAYMVRSFCAKVTLMHRNRDRRSEGERRP